MRGFFYTPPAPKLAWVQAGYKKISHVDGVAGFH
jgi:hypothetical protein